MEIKLKGIHIQNFKGCKDRKIEFGDDTKISGANATGKTTVFDAFTWLLFGKDSLGSAKFDIRPLDVDGKMIDNVEITVEATLEISCEDNVEEYVLKKVQKQKWVKKRGTDTTEFQGNVNEFEINGYPKSEKEFKEFIGNIIDEKVFNLVTNPSAFNTLQWKEQREMLMQFVGNFTDVQIAEECGDKFSRLLPELKLASTDDILKKYTKAKSTLNKDMVEIPARIDEVSKQLVMVDVGALEVEKAAKEVALQKVEDELFGGAEKLNEINLKRKQVMEAKISLNALQNKANDDLSEKRRTTREGVHLKERKVEEIKSEILGITHEIERAVREKGRAEENKRRYADEWKREKISVFPEFVPLPDFIEPAPLSETDLSCPTCRQALPENVRKQRIADYEERCKKAREDYDAKVTAHENKYREDKEGFEKKRSDRLNEITEKGQKSADNVRMYQKMIDERKNVLDKLNADLKVAEEELQKEKSLLNSIPEVANMTSNEEYQSILKQIENLESEIEKMRGKSGNVELEAQKSILRDEIAIIEMKIKSVDNTKVEERIAELEKEKAEVGQKIAEQEQMIDLTEEFIREKMSRISSVINEKFKIVSFKLFDNQINGGLKECCECTVNGVPYSSLNNGMRICAGLDIVQSLSELNAVNCPVFIDNSEAVNESNFPKMPNQMVYLVVTDDKELKVEV